MSSLLYVGLVVSLRLRPTLSTTPALSTLGNALSNVITVPSHFSRSVFFNIFDVVYRILGFFISWSSSSPCLPIPPSSVSSHCSPPHLDQWDNQSELGPTPVINSPSLLVKSEAAGSLSAACYDWNWRNVTTFVPWKWLCSVPGNNWDVRQ